MGKLREQMQREMDLKGYSPKTTSLYLRHMGTYVGYIDKCPTQAGEEEVKDYLHHLISDQKRSRSYVNQAYSALKIFYEKVVMKPVVMGQVPRVSLPQRLPVVLSPAEVVALLCGLQNLKHRTILTVIYSGGLRLSEACALQVRDIDSHRMRILIRQGKGRKDRYTLLAHHTLKLLRVYWQAYRSPSVVVWRPNSRPTDLHAQCSKGDEERPFEGQD